ncbi:SDR family oxidoreductase [Zhongshania sp. BJYM1]|uniref:SDR family oxidoreductase n=1 Tax=Zhongshania aquatica TaxID=2965069 RepID=UPI0022B5DC67|nr:SDR family oxidoreductase [Marortus sp. BJYM1]
MSKREIAVVVGATGDMGKHIVRGLVQAGLKVIAVARSEGAVSALVNESEFIVPCICDIASDESIAAISSTIDNDVRMVVHGPGVATAGGVMVAPTDSISDAVNIKVAGLMRLVRSVDPYLVKESRIVAIGGHYGFEPTAYAATAGVANAALANLIRQYSWAYGSRGITAHLVAPGPADTERLMRVASARAEREGISQDQVMANMKSESAINSFTKLEEVAWAVKMLLAPEANSMAGSTLFLDAGRRRGLP